MSEKIAKHGDHEHRYRTVKVEVYGLKIDDTNGSGSVIEAFGKDSETYKRVAEKMIKYFKFLDSQEALYDDLPEGTKLTNLVDFLNSPTYKMTGHTLKDPNDYFLLGWIWGGILSQTQLPDEIKDLLMKMIEKKLGGEEK